MALSGDFYVGNVGKNMPTKKQRRFLKRGIYEQQWAMPSCPRSGWCLHYTKPLKSETFRRNIKNFLKNIKKHIFAA